MESNSVPTDNALTNSLLDDAEPWATPQANDGCCPILQRTVSCVGEAPCGWLVFVPKFCCQSLRAISVLALSRDGARRLVAIHEVMKNLCYLAPPSVVALQRATDLVEHIPGYGGFRDRLGHPLITEVATVPPFNGEWTRMWEPEGTVGIFHVPHREQRVVFYMHGGAFALCNARTHKDITGRIARNLRAHVFSVVYRRPPLHPFPAAFDDVVNAYLKLIENVAPERIIVAGESAGGNLAASLCLELSRRGAPLPAGAILISPWVDLTDFDHARWTPESPDYLPLYLARVLRDGYVGSGSSHDDRISPTLSDNLASLPPTLLMWGDAESLATQCEEFSAKLVGAGVDLSQYVGKDQVHAFPLFADLAYGGLARLISLLSLGVLLFALALSIGVISFVLDREHLEDLQTEHRIVLAVSIIIFFVTGCLAIRVAALCPRSSSNVESFNNMPDVGELPPVLEAYQRMQQFAGRVWDVEA